MTPQRLRDVLAHFTPALSVEDYQSLQAAVRDAERYRWWRKRFVDDKPFAISAQRPLTEEELDAAVDRAMAGEATK